MLKEMKKVGVDPAKWMGLVQCYLRGWTSIPFTRDEGYDRDLLKFYDEFIGALLKETEKDISGSYELSSRDVNRACAYRGKLYRILHAVLPDDGRKSGGIGLLPDVEYHGMITHWTDDVTFSDLRSSLAQNRKYIILEADTGSHIGLDVNRFFEYIGAEEPGKREIIFPMYRDCIKEYRMTLGKFLEMKEQRD